MGERIQNVRQQEWNGYKFRSTFEAEVAKSLYAMGIPYRYENRKIVLQEGFRSPFQKDKIRALTYTPDFEVGNIIIECKGFETPEWKIKKKLLLKYLMEHEPETKFYQIHDHSKSFLKVLDENLESLGYVVKVREQPKKRNTVTEEMTFSSITEALQKLNMEGKTLGPILRSLTGQRDWTYGHSWKIEKLNN